jgi:hypothetical protein
MLPAGGGLAFANSIDVQPGNNYTITIGAGGKGINAAGEASWFISNATVVARGGGGGSLTGGAGGGFFVASRYTSAGGGTGGRGGDQSWWVCLLAVRLSLTPSTAAVCCHRWPNMMSAACT